MAEPSDLSTQKRKRQQQLMLLGALGVAGVVLGGAYLLIADKGRAPARKKAEQEVVFSTSVSHVDDRGIWQERMQNQLQQAIGKTKDLDEKLKALDKPAAAEQDPKMQALQSQLDAMKAQLQDALHAQQQAQKILPKLPPLPPTSRFSSSDARASMLLGVDDMELELTATANPLPNKNPDSFVPAGSFVRAVLLGAADAPAGVTSSAQPIPVLFRILDQGVLPNKHHSHLKDCLVTASMVGDISSERGEVRLEKMSCTQPDGEIIEQNVQGVAYGMDAKSGIRGTPVWREGALLERAFVSGALSGISNGVSQSYVTNSTSPLGSTSTVNSGDIFKYGAAEGASNAMEKLADYNIKRAEQYHPVIQVSAGQAADLVFLTGFYLDGREVKGGENEAKDEQPKLFPEPELAKLAYQHAKELAKEEARSALKQFTAPGGV